MTLSQIMRKANLLVGEGYDRRAAMFEAWRQAKYRPCYVNVGAFIPCYVDLNDPKARRDLFRDTLILVGIDVLLVFILLFKEGILI